jgi:hypothetical protein
MKEPAVIRSPRLLRARRADNDDLAGRFGSRPTVVPTQGQSSEFSRGENSVSTRFRRGDA